MKKDLDKNIIIIPQRGCCRTDMLMAYMLEMYKSTGKKFTYVRKDNNNKKRK